MIGFCRKRKNSGPLSSRRVNDLQGTTVRLARGGVEFVIAGGLAALMHGGSLMTRDVDVACRMAPSNLVKIFESFAKLNPVHRMTPKRVPFTLEQARRGGLKNLYLSTDLGQLDCLGEIKGIGGYEECLKRSIQVPLDDVVLQVLSLEAMIDAKKAMGRPRDVHAVVELEAIREKLRGQPEN